MNQNRQPPRGLAATVTRPKSPQKSARSAAETFRLAIINIHAGRVAARVQQWVDEFPPVP